MDKTLKNHRETKLRTSLAILRGIDYLREFKPKSNVTQSQWGSYLDQLFRDIYLKIFADTSPIAPQQRLAGMLESAQRAYELNTIFHDFAEKFYDPNGFFATTDHHHNAKTMAALYLTLEAFEPFERDTSLVLRLFFAAIGQMRGFQEKLGGIDFRRLSRRHVDRLIDGNQTHEEMTAIFMAAMSRGRSQEYRENTPPHFYWEDRSVTLYGKRFIEANRQEVAIEYFQKIDENVPLIVLVNGALVTKDCCVELASKHMEAGELLGTLRIAREHWVARLADLKQEIYGKPAIDGIDSAEAALPICMNLHPLSLLSHSQHERVEDYLENEFGAEIIDLQNPIFAQEVLDSLGSDNRAIQIVQLAAQRMQYIVPAMRDSIHAELANQPQAKMPKGATPQLAMTMGGSGSGKGSNHYFRKHYTDSDGAIRRDFIYASLDEGRPYSDLYHVLIAAGHHADDYEAVHLWADTRRNWLCDAAREGRYNVIFDGSGIDYKNRYDKIVAAFSLAGYQTKVIAADCMLISPQSRRDKYPVPALDRIMYRAGYKPDGTHLPPKENGHYRTLPWRIALNKHIGFPSSLIAALSDKHLSKIIMIDNAGKLGDDQVIAESFLLEDSELQALESAKNYGDLSATLRTENLLPYGQIATHIEEENCSYLAARVGGMNHVLVITDVERMIDVIEKGQLNPNAHGPSNLTLVRFLASFIINRIDKPDGIDMTPDEVRAAYEQVLSQNADTPRPNYLRLNAG